MLEYYEYIIHPTTNIYIYLPTYLFKQVKNNNIYKIIKKQNYNKMKNI